MEAHLNCPICLEFATDAVEAFCCHQVMCESCVGGLQSCPMCRTAPLRTNASLLARRMIDEFMTKCKFCSAEMKHGSLRNHIKVCPDRLHQCSAPGCQFTGTKSSFLSHLVDSHSLQLLSDHAKLFSSSSNVVLDRKEEVNPVAITMNSAGNRARPGRNGKFYCGRRLDFFCRCCDGFCGPDEGCNCRSCMKLDVQARSLRPNFLVNREGCVAQRLPNGRWYCGRRVMEVSPLCDGYCGPQDGPSCHACAQLSPYESS